MKSQVKLLVLSIIALIFFGVAAFFTRHLIFGDVVGTYDQAAANRTEYNDKWVSLEVVACLGKYAEKTESTNFIPTGHDYYYVIWMKDGSFMPISVSSKADREYLDNEVQTPCRRRAADPDIGFCQFFCKFSEGKKETFKGRGIPA